MICATSQGSDQPAHTRRLIRAFACRLVKLLIELNLVFLSLTGGCTGSSESTLVKMAHCWKSHVTVQIFLNTGPRMQSVTCLATDTCLTADPGVPSLIAARSHTFMEIDREIFSTVISLPSEK